MWGAFFKRRGGWGGSGGVGVCGGGGGGGGVGFWLDSGGLGGSYIVACHFKGLIKINTEHFEL